MIGRVRLGYPCMTMVMSEKMRTVTQKTLEGIKDKKKVYSKILELSENNLKVLDLTLDWNYQNKVNFFRIYSDLFPHLSNTKLESLVGAESASAYRTLYPFVAKIMEIGRKIVKYDIRVTFHPNEFACLGSPRKEVIDAAIIDLSWQAKMIDIFESAAEDHEKEKFKAHFKDSVLVLHGGGQYGDKQSALRRWADTFKKMPEYISRRLVIENDERNYSPMDLLSLSKEIKIPIVVDYFHQECYEKIHPETEKCDWEKVLPQVLSVWDERKITPKFHVSQQSQGRRIGTHSDSLTKLPGVVLKLQDEGKSFDLMLECKEKEKVVQKMVKMYKERFSHIEDNSELVGSLKRSDSLCFSDHFGFENPKDECENELVQTDVKDSEEDQGDIGKRRTRSKSGKLKKDNKEVGDGGLMEKKQVSSAKFNTSTGNGQKRKKPIV